MPDLIQEINLIMEDAAKGLAAALSEAEIEAVRVKVSGRNGVLTALSSTMGTLQPEERKAAGRAFNEAKNRFQALFDEAGERIKEKSAGIEAGSIDVTVPGRKWGCGRKHPVTRVIDDCVAAFRRMGYIVAAGPEIDTVWHNFDALNTPQNHPSRDIKDTFYLADGRVMRTHTSPVQVRVMSSQEPPVRIVSPGRCYRRDTPDATHGVYFHQIEGLYIDKNVSMGDLKAALLNFAHEVFGPGIDIRLRPHFFPFTEPSVECDFSCVICKGKGCRVCKNSGWLEIAGAGMVDPNVLRNVGYDPEKWSGFAFGMGIERIAMLRYRINDLRILSENDARFLEQF